MKLFGKRRKNNKGFSLVEVICAVAILGVTSTAIGSAMIVSTQNYQRGNAEVDVQKEAQTVTNLVGNLMVDALDVDVSTDETGAQIVLIKKEGKEYTLTYKDNTISYKEKNTNDSTEVTGCLAENVTEFNVVVPAGDFDKSDKNVGVKMEVSTGGKEYKATFNNTARNGQGTNVGATQMARINLTESVVILEPGQTYDFNITVDGMTPDEAGIKWGTPTEYSADAVVGGTQFDDANTTSSCGKLEVGVNAEGVLAFNVWTDSVHDAEGNPLDTRQVLVYIRRVNDINLTGTVKDASGNVPNGNNAYKAGATYRIDAKAVGTSLDKALGLNNYDNDYKNPYWIEFDYTMTGGNGNKDSYMSVTANAQNTDNPYFQFTLLQDMPNNSEIKIIAKAKHPAGVNKTGTVYDTVVKEYPIEYVFNPWSMEGDIVRGTDGFKIMFDNTEYDKILDDYDATRSKKYITIYEATVDENGEFTPSATPLITKALTDSGSTTHFQASDSVHFAPEKDYVFEMRIEFYDDSGNLKWPTTNTSPEMYMYRYNLGGVMMTYECKQNGQGTASNPYVLEQNNDDYFKFETLYYGLTQNVMQSYIRYEVYKLTEGAEPELTTDIKAENKDMDKLAVKPTTTGNYKIVPYLEGFSYKLPSGANRTVARTEMSRGEEGIIYIKVE